MAGKFSRNCGRSSGLNRIEGMFIAGHAVVHKVERACCESVRRKKSISKVTQSDAGSKGHLLRAETSTNAVDGECDCDTLVGQQYSVWPPRKRMTPLLSWAGERWVQQHSSTHSFGSHWKIPSSTEEVGLMLKACRNRAIGAFSMLQKAGD